MSEVQRFLTQGSHWMPIGGFRTDTVSFRLDKPFTRYYVKMISPSVVSGYSVVSAPRPGAAGRQKLVIQSWGLPMTTVTYRVFVYSGKPVAIRIVKGSDDWENRLSTATQQGVGVNLVIRGIEARDLYRHISMSAPRDVEVPADLLFGPDEDWAERDDEDDGEDTDLVVSDPEYAVQVEGPAAEPVTIGVTVAIVAGIVMVAGMATLAAIMIAAITRGYDVPAVSYKAKTPVGDHEIVFRLKAPR